MLIVVILIVILLNVDRLSAAILNTLNCTVTLNIKTLNITTLSIKYGNVSFHFYL